MNNERTVKSVFTHFLFVNSDNSVPKQGMQFLSSRLFYIGGFHSLEDVQRFLENKALEMSDDNVSEYNIGVVDTSGNVIYEPGDNYLFYDGYSFFAKGLDNLAQKELECIIHFGDAELLEVEQEII